MKFIKSIAFCIILCNQLIGQTVYNIENTSNLNSQGGCGVICDAGVIAQVISNVSCNGGSDASASATAGSLCHLIFFDTSYLWSNGQRTRIATGLSAGVHTVHYYFDSQCFPYATITITEPSLLESSATDNADGTATASATGGTPFYTYLWDANASNQTTSRAMGLTNNTYTVTITDANGCTSVSSVTVTGAADNVSINHIATLKNLSMFPNPATANVFVDLDLTESQDIVIRIVNVIGQTVLENSAGTIQNQRIELATSELPTGVYMVQFFIGTEMTTRKLIVDKR